MTRTLPPLTVEVACSGARHRITWRRGELVLHDHDVEAERVAQNLGADLPYCLRALEAITSGEVDLVSLLGEEDENPRQRGLRQQGGRFTFLASVAGQTGVSIHTPSKGFFVSGAQVQPHIQAIIRRHKHQESVWELPRPLRHRLVLAAALEADAPPDVVDALDALASGRIELDRQTFRRLSRDLDRLGQRTGALDDDEDRVLARFFDGTRLSEVPSHRSKRLVVLQRLAREFVAEVDYDEKQVNRILSAFHPDFAALRRYLVDEGLMVRESGVYRRAPVGADAQP